MTTIQESSSVDSATTVEATRRWVLSMRNSSCNWHSVGAAASTGRRVVKTSQFQKCLDACDLDPGCSGWVVWNAAESTCVLQQVFNI